MAKHSAPFAKVHDDNGQTWLPVVILNSNLVTVDNDSMANDTYPQIADRLVQ